MYRDGAPAAASGAMSLSLQATFTPLRAHAGLLAERTEIMGSARVEIAAGAERFSFNGLGQFHEQPQTAARFVTPFTTGARSILLRGACALIACLFTGDMREVRQLLALDEATLKQVRDRAVEHPAD